MQKLNSVTTYLIILFLSIELPYQSFGQTVEEFDSLETELRKKSELDRFEGIYSYHFDTSIHKILIIKTDIGQLYPFYHMYELQNDSISSSWLTTCTSSQDLPDILLLIQPGAQDAVPVALKFSPSGNVFSRLAVDQQRSTINSGKLNINVPKDDLPQFFKIYPNKKHPLKIPEIRYGKKAVSWSNKAIFPLNQKNETLRWKATYYTSSKSYGGSTQGFLLLTLLSLSEKDTVYEAFYKNTAVEKHQTTGEAIRVEFRLVEVLNACEFCEFQPLKFIAEREKTKTLAMILDKEKASLATILNADGTSIDLNQVNIVENTANFLKNTREDNYEKIIKHLYTGKKASIPVSNRNIHFYSEENFKKYIEAERDFSSLASINDFINRTMYNFTNSNFFDEKGIWPAFFVMALPEVQKYIEPLLLPKIDSINAIPGDLEKGLAANEFRDYLKINYPGVQRVSIQLLGRLPDVDIEKVRNNRELEFFRNRIENEGISIKIIDEIYKKYKIEGNYALSPFMREITKENHEWYADTISKLQVNSEEFAILRNWLEAFRFQSFIELQSIMVKKILKNEGYAYPAEVFNYILADARTYRYGWRDDYLLPHKLYSRLQQTGLNYPFDLYMVFIQIMIGNVETAVSIYNSSSFSQRYGRDIFSQGDILNYVVISSYWDDGSYPFTKTKFSWKEDIYEVLYKNGWETDRQYITTKTREHYVSHISRYAAEIYQKQIPHQGKDGWKVYGERGYFQDFVELFLRKDLDHYIKSNFFQYYSSAFIYKTSMFGRKIVVRDKYSEDNFGDGGINLLYLLPKEESAKCMIDQKEPFHYTVEKFSECYK